eukprot:COSAG05_NODE_3284_length_2177_cov_2.952358_1_plen_34_part_10
MLELCAPMTDKILDLNVYPFSGCFHFITPLTMCV